MLAKAFQIHLPFKLHHHQYSSVQFSSSVVSDSLRPHESQHAGTHMHFGILLYCPSIFLFPIINLYVKESEVAR